MVSIAFRQLWAGGYGSDRQLWGRSSGHLLALALVRALALGLAMGTIGNFWGDHHATGWLWFGLELWLWLWERSVAFGAIIMPLAG